MSDIIDSDVLGDVRLLSTGQLAKLLCRKPQTIRKWLSQENLPDGLPMPLKINRRNFWRYEDICNFLSTV